MININYIGRYGNNLFQYITAIILSKKFNQKISNPFLNKITLFDNNLHELDSLESSLVVDDSNILDILELDDLNSNIVLNGYFQNRGILKILKEKRDFLFTDFKKKNGTFVHVRIGDLIDDISRICSLKYYEKALEGLPEGYISSDSPENDMIKYLSKKFNLKIVDDSPENTIIYGCQFDNKILSLGTFSWWIGFLGNQNNVICPVQKEYREWHGDIFSFLDWKEVSIK